MFAEELDNGIRVPLFYVQRLLHLTVLSHEFDDRVRTANVVDFESRPGARVLRIDERLHLREPPYFSSAYLDLGDRVNLDRTLLELVLRAAALARLYQALEMKLGKLFATAAQQT